ncbi:MAG TPA: D-hexose-6-phosphate mutarotase [Longimicrobium sp.]|jgi:glucose-6-phosphate 1-epimerase
MTDASAAVEAGENDLPCVILAHPSGARAEAYAHGAHLTSYVPAGGEEVFFVSRQARFDAASAIRGGVPVVFPQFAEQGPLPKHGFARVAEWALPEAGGADGVARATFVLTDSPETLNLWPHTFLASLVVELDEGGLELRLDVFNRGAEEIRFTAALHSYFRVADVREAAVLGLKGISFHDKELDRDRAQDEDELTVGGPLDRVYRGAPDLLRIRDGAGGRMLVLEKGGFADAVVWNPWIEGAAKLDDMADDEYLQMLCVEVGSVAVPVRLEAGGRWSAWQRVSVESL